MWSIHSLLILLLPGCLLHLSAGQDLFFSVFVSNSSTLATVQAVSVIDGALQLSAVDPMVMRNTEFDTMCKIQRGQMQLAADVNMGSIALIDGSCSSVSENLSKTKNHTIMIIFSSTSAAINNNTVTMGTYRTIPSDRALPPSLVPLFMEYEWQRLSLVTTTTGSQYTELKRLITNQLNHNTTVHTSTLLEIDIPNNTNINDSIDALFNGQPHIYFLNTDILTGIHFLCQAFTQSRYYPNYLWIMPGWWYQVGVSSQWWDDESLLIGTTCSNMSDVFTVLNMSLIMRAIPLNESNIEDNEALVFDTSSIQTSDYSTNSYAVDAALSLTVAINQTESLSNGTYDNLVSAYNNVTFYGASGYVSFDKNGDRANTQVLIQQFIYNEQQSNTIQVMDIATIQNGTNFSYITTTAVFPDGIPPDGTPIDIINIVELGVTIFIVILCFIGLLFAIICLLFNIIFKDKKIVKLSSPNLNYFLLAGVMSLLFGMIFYVIGTRDIELLLPICTLRRILVSVGHDIGFTVALVKTWRIHHIFKNPKPNKRAPKDWKLFMSAFIIVSVDMVISVLLFIPDNIWNKVGFILDKEFSSTINDQGVTVEHYAPACGSTIYYLIWIAFTTIFKLILHVIAIVLSFRIRTVVVDTLNEFRYTSIIVYTSTVLIVILVTVLVAAVNYINVYAIMVPLLVFIEVLVFLSFSFVPKMVALYRDPKGMHVFDKPNKKKNSILQMGDSLKRNVSLSYYNRKESTVKDDDSGRCTLDSKDQKDINNKDSPKKEEFDSVFIENGSPVTKENGHLEQEGDPVNNKEPEVDYSVNNTDNNVSDSVLVNNNVSRKETDV